MSDGYEWRAKTPDGRSLTREEWDAYVRDVSLRALNESKAAAMTPEEAARHLTNAWRQAGIRIVPTAGQESAGLN